VVIGLIGAENSHAAHFLETINRQQRYGGVSIKHIYGGDDPEKSCKLAGEFDLQNCGSEEEVIENSDAVVVTYRKGSLHHDAVMKALRAGKSVFNDKPFATKTGDAREIADYARGGNLLLCGGSNIKSLEGVASAAQKIEPGDTVVISFAADPDSEYDGYFFYGIHSVETCLTLFGLDYRSVSSTRDGGTVVSIVSYPKNKCVIMTSPGLLRLDITVYGNDKTVHYPVSLEYESVGPDEFVQMLLSNKPPRDYEFYAKAVELTNDIIRSSGI